MKFRTQVTVDGINRVVIPTHRGIQLWEKVLTRGLGGRKWKLATINGEKVQGKHYKEPVDMRRWIAQYENENYELWFRETTLNIKHKIESRCGECHGCVVLDAVHKTAHGKDRKICPIKVRN
jgi:hypothetical protein